MFTLLREIPNEVNPHMRQIADALLPKFPTKKGHGWKWFEQVSAATTHWSELTGQWQKWCLFAPNVWDECAFPLILLVPDDAGDDVLQGTIQDFDLKTGFSFNVTATPARTLL